MRSILCELLLLSCLVKIALTNPIATSLFNKELLGEPLSVNFLSDQELLISSVKGLVSKINLERGQTIWRKNLMYPTKLNLKSEDKYSIFVNEEKNYIDLYNNEKNQLIWSLNYAQKRSPYRTYKLIKYLISSFSENMIGFFLESSSLKIFNDERILAENESIGANEEFIDIIYDKENKIVYDVRLDSQNSTLKITSNKIGVIYETGKFKTTIDFEVKMKKKISKVLSTKNYLILFTGKNHYTVISLSNSSNYEIFINENVLDVSEFFYSDKLTLRTKTRLITFDLNKNDQKELQINHPESNQVSFVSKLESIKYNSLLFFRSDWNKLVIDEFEPSINKMDSSVQIELQENCVIKNIFSGFLNEQFKGYSLIVCTSLKLLMIDLNAKRVLWNHDSGLTNLAFSKIIYYNIEVDQSVDYTASHFHKFEDFVQNTQITSLLTNIVSTIYNDIIDLSKRAYNNFESNFISRSNKVTEDTFSEYSYMLVLFTEARDLYLYNCLTGELKFKQQFAEKNLLSAEHESFHSTPVIKLKLQDVNNNNIHIFTINLLNFQVTSGEVFESTLSLVNSMNLSELVGENNNRGYNIKHDSSLIDTQVLIKRDKSNLYGIKVFSEKNADQTSLKMLWNLNLDNSTIIDFKLSNFHKHSTTTYLSGGKILYKFLDKNLGVVVYTSDRKTLYLTIMKSDSGKILYQATIAHVDFNQRINVLFEENIVLVSYIKKEKSINRNEVFVVEIIKREIDDSFIYLMEKVLQFESRMEKTSDENDLVFQEACYILPKRVKHMFASETKLNVSNKQIILVFENNFVHFLDIRFAGARRPLTKGNPPVIDPIMNSPYTDLEFAPYSPILMIDYKHSLSDNFVNDVIDNIVVSPTEYESTFLLCSTGGNIACYKVYPDKNYDSLHLMFGFNLIGLFLIGIISITYLLRKYVKKIELRNSFLSS